MRGKSRRIFGFFTTRNPKLKTQNFFMDIETLREYCLSKPGTTENFPFDEVTLVIRVVNKIFVFLPLDNPTSIALKCQPERAVALREAYPEITPGWHLNKNHWNTVGLDGNLTGAFIFQLVDHSYELVVAGLKKAEKEMLKNL